MISPELLTKIRSSFPALERKHAGFPVAYFDGPGGTQVSRQVADAMTDYLLHHNANTHWVYPTSVETDELLLEAKQAVADFLNCDVAEVSFGANMTTLTFHLARTLARDWSPGDEIVVTELDHHANVDTWESILGEHEIVVRKAPFDTSTGQLIWSEFENLLNPKTRLVAFGAASNALGTINEVRRAAEAAHKVGAKIFVDAVHYASHELVDVKEFDCDFLACSAYKWYGPHVGVLYSKKEHLAGLSVPKLAPAPNEGGERLETGTLNHEGIVGTGAAVDFMASIGEGDSRRAKLESAFSMMHESGMALISKLWNELQEIDGVQTFGPSPSENRTATLSFVVKDAPSAEVAKYLADNFGVFVSDGDFYASTVVSRLGLVEQGLVRVGCACYTTEEEIDRLLKGVQEFVDTH